MPIGVECDECGARYKLPDNRAGETIRCKSCGADIEVPSGPSPRSRGPSPVGRNRRPKKAAGPPVGLFIGAGIGVMVLIAVVAVGLTMLRSDPGPPQAAADPVAPEATTAAGPLPADPSTIASAKVDSAEANPSASNSLPGSNLPVPASSATPASPAPSGFQKPQDRLTRVEFEKSAEWTVQPDPAPENEPFVSQKLLKLPLGESLSSSGMLTYPVSPSPFVAVKKGTGSKDSVEIFNLTTGSRTGSVPGMAAGGHLALSPDGQYLAFVQLGQRTMSVYDIKAKKTLGELALGTKEAEFRPGVLAIPRPDRLVAFSNLDRTIKTWELPSGQLLSEIKGTDKLRPEVLFAFSPGGKWLAVCADFLTKPIEIFELATGKLAGSLKIVGQASSVTMMGLAFSPTGDELAALYDITSRGEQQDTTQFVVWEVASGKIRDDFDISPLLKKQLDPEYEMERLEPFPNGRRWLVHSRGIIDRDTKSLVYSFPKIERTYRTPVRRIMGEDWLVGIAQDRGNHRLETVKLDEDVIASSAKSLSAGGQASDSGLPPLTATDYTEADAALTSPNWSLVPTVVPVSDKWAPSTTIALDGGNLREVVVNPGSPSIAAIRIGVQEDLNDSKYQAALKLQEMEAASRSKRYGFSPPQAIAKESLVATYSLEDGQKQAQISLPFSYTLLALSPNGQQALLEHHGGSGRLDLYQLSEKGQHVVGWRPFRQAKEDREREVRAASFLDDQSLLTLSRGDLLVLWSLPDLKPVWQLPDVRQFAVSPGRESIAFVQGNLLEDKNLAFLDPKTGEGQGTIPLDSECLAIAYHPSGNLLATSQGNNADKLITIVDLTSGETVSKIPVPTVGTHLAWMGDNYLLLDHRQLISRDHEAVVWSYDPGQALFPPVMPGGRCWFVTGNTKRALLQSIALPTNDLEEKLKGASLADKALVKPGDTVSLKFQVGSQSELATLKPLLEENLPKAVQKAQLMVADNASTTVLAELNHRSEGTTTLSKIGDRSEQQTVTIKIIELKITYQQGGKTLWSTSRSARNVDQLLVSLKPGETAQAACDRQLTSRVTAIISSLKLPGYLFGDDARKGLGQSPLAAAK